MMFSLRRAAQGDSEFLFNLRNDESVRRVSRSTGRIAFAEHEAWLAKKLADPESILFIAEAGGASIAQIRFDRKDAERAEISIAVVAAFRGKGYGTKIVSEATELFLRERPDTREVRAYVNRGNEASLRSFAKAGYQRMEDVEDAGAMRHLFVFERVRPTP